ncbi:MAG: ABC transporter substrate-binding protein [Candidatus Hermodarchaeia archaeon]|jgi:ABC-type transport system substrate-binding protein
MNQQKRQRIAILFITLVFTTSSVALIPTTHGNVPLFTIYLCVDDDNPRLLAAAGIMRDSFRRLNIDAQVAPATTSSWFNRIFFPNASQLGAIHEEGGWDTVTIGCTWDKYMLDPSKFYDSNAIPLFNFILLDNYQNDLLLAEIRRTFNEAQRWELMKDWQARIHNLSPSAILFYPNKTFAYDPGWIGFEDASYLFPVYGDPIVRHPSEIEWVIGGHYDPDSFMPMIERDDGFTIGGVYESLFRYMNNQDFFNFNQTPSLAATDWVIEDNGLNWTLNLRSDVFWPTGHRFNASDVYMTYRAHVTPVVNAELYDKFVSAGLNNESFEILDTHRIRIQFNETIGPYAWTRNLLNIEPLPYFALSNVAWEDWHHHPISEGTQWTTEDVNGDPYTCYGPLGLGPFVCNAASSGEDQASRSFTAYLRGSSNDLGLANGTKIPYFMGDNGFGTSPLPLVYQAKYYPWHDVDHLANGSIDLVHPKSLHYSRVNDVSLPWGKTVPAFFDNFQVLGFNLHHPVFGTGEATPNGQRYPTKAWQYAKFVRQALNHLIPRQAMIDQILDGHAVLGLECIPPSSNAYNSELEPYAYDTEMAKTLLGQAGYEFPDTPILDPILALFTSIGFILLANVIVVIVFLFYQKRSRKTMIAETP